MVIVEKIILYMPGKFWYDEILAIKGQIKFDHFLPKIDSFWLMISNHCYESFQFFVWKYFI